MEMIHPLIEEFAKEYTSPENALLAKIASYTYTSHPQPHMLSGHVQGKLLQMISQMIRPSRILEVGTFTGYSTLCLAEGLTESGLLHTIELRPETANIAQSYFDQSPLGAKIILHTGAAADIIPTLTESWDLVFIDADKTGYINYFTLILPHIKKNGFILVDNIFFHGQVFGQNIKNKNAKAITSFNQFIKERNDIDKLVLTIRDGLYLLRKL